MRGRFAPYIVGIGLLGLATIMVFFSAYALILGEVAADFYLTALLSAAVGLALVKLGASAAEPTRREALVAVLLVWFSVPLFGAIPYWMAAGLSPLNALFESMSGFTTTGATVIQDFENVPKSLFMWRAMEQWLGGIGIIVLFIAVFPNLAIAGRQLFFAEAPGPTEERLTPKLRNTANAVLVVYLGLTVLCVAAYMAVGMTPYDAVAHALTTLSAGGFSPEAGSFQSFGASAQWIAVVFMGLAGLNFSLQYRAAVLGRPRDLLRDPEFRAYLAVIAGAAALLIFALRGVYSLSEAVRHGFFQVLSILTTAGFASVDFAAWPMRAQVILVLLMFIGGSAGSAAGGIKIVRLLIIAKNAFSGLRQTLHPRAIVPVRIGSRIIPKDIVLAVSVFVSLYVAVFVFSTAALVYLGEDFMTALTASIASLGNIGPGLAGVGPMANFAELGPVSRGILIFDMYAGRLEITTVLVMLDPDWWHLPRRFLSS